MSYYFSKKIKDSFGETEAGQIEVSMVDPLVAMQAIDNPGLYEIAQQVRDKLNNVITSTN